MSCPFETEEGHDIPLIFSELASQEADLKVRQRAQSVPGSILGSSALTFAVCCVWHVTPAQVPVPS